MQNLNNKLSIIIPCYNEEKYIGELLNKLLLEVDPTEIIVIDDYSSDNSVQIVKGINDGRIKLISNEANMGKGFSINRGFKIAEGEIILIQDADPEYSPKDINFLLTPFSEENADFVIGTRFQTKYKRKIGYFYHTIFNKLITFFLNFKSNTNFTDVECGYKVFKKKLLKQFTLKEKRFGIEIELIRKITKLNIKMYEVPVSYEMRSYSMGKKIGLKDALAALICLIKY